MFNPSVASRKSSYKLPPTQITDKLVSQQARRSKALDDQKRRRALKVDSSRQLDLFADLTLGASDDDDDEDDEDLGVTNVTTPSMVPYVSMLQSADASHEPDAVTNPPRASAPLPTSDSPPTPQGKNRFKKKKKKKKRGANKPSKWADKCMYAELLEMQPDDPWGAHDGLPADLDTAWVAVAPVPVGKRCLAVTHQSAGVAGIVPNTTLRSRLLGKTLMNRFPSSLPPLTVLDCILDANWRSNGILHVLDVVKWKGQDVADCEAPFRFWWRDTRLAELSQGLPPSISFTTPAHSAGPGDKDREAQLCFPYPIKFLPVPYHTDTSPRALYTQVIPLARAPRSVPVEVPMRSPVHPPPSTEEGGMDVELIHKFTFRSTSSPPSIAMAPAQTLIPSDGLLLYISEASYEAGTSPLSSWVPLTSYSQPAEGTEMGTRDDDGQMPDAILQEGPLDLFERLVKRRLDRCSGQEQGASMDMDV